jgi:Ribonuclease G/E
MADGPDALLPLAKDGPALTEGAAVEVTVIAEARADKPGAPKAATVRLLGPSDGGPRLIQPAPALEDRLAALAPGAELVAGLHAREACDQAQDEALATLHPLPGGGTISLEPTRALVAIDVDVGGRAGGDPRRLARQTNLAAIAEAARLLRLKGLGGLVVMDLVGKGHDGKVLAEAARTAFAPEGVAVGIGPISRFGLFELSLPHAGTPVADRLLDEAGQISAATAAFALLRAMEREARAEPGGRLLAYADVDVAAVAEAHLPALAARIGARFKLEAKPGLGHRFEVSVS